MSPLFQSQSCIGRHLAPAHPRPPWFSPFSPTHNFIDNFRQKLLDTFHSTSVTLHNCQVVAALYSLDFDVLLSSFYKVTLTTSLIPPAVRFSFLDLQSTLLDKSAQQLKHIVLVCSCLEVCILVWLAAAVDVHDLDSAGLHQNYFLQYSSHHWKSFPLIFRACLFNRSAKVSISDKLSILQLCSFVS